MNLFIYLFCGLVLNNTKVRNYASLNFGVTMIRRPIFIDSDSLDGATSKSTVKGGLVGIQMIKIVGRLGSSMAFTEWIK